MNDRHCVWCKAGVSTIQSPVLTRLTPTSALYDWVQRAAGREVNLGHLRAELRILPGQTVVDVGAGTGTMAGLVPSEARYVGVDADAGMLQRLRHKHEGRFAVRCDAARLGLADRFADWTLCVAVTHHLPDDALPRVIAELARVTRGSLVFLDALRARAWGRGALLWSLDRGAYPRTEGALLAALDAAFAIRRIKRYAVHHDYLLCVGEPRTL